LKDDEEELLLDELVRVSVPSNYSSISGFIETILSMEIEMNIKNQLIMKRILKNMVV
jgi:hypothetical protein